MKQGPGWCTHGLAAWALLCAAGGASAADLGFYVVLDSAATSANVSMEDFHYATYNNFYPSEPMDFAKDTKARGYNITVGYQLGSYFAIEGSYVQAGKFTYDFLFAGAGVGGADIAGRWKLKPVGPTVAAVGLLPLGPYFSADAHAGFFFVENKHNFYREGEDVGSISDSKTAPYYGAGVAWWITGQVALRLGFNEYYKAIKYRGPFESSLFKRNATQYTLGLRYSYGY
jgi:opacity protein-like surface antigen